MNERLWALGAQAGARLKARGETIAVAETSAGGLISASLLAVPGASAYFVGGAVTYSRRSIRGLAGIFIEDMRAQGIRSSSEPYAALLAAAIRAKHGNITWGLAETGAAGPQGNAYGDPAGHTCLALAGPVIIPARLDPDSSGLPTPSWSAKADHPRLSPRASIFSGAGTTTRTWRTGRDDRLENMWAFATAALELLIENLA